MCVCGGGGVCACVWEGTRNQIKKSCSRFETVTLHAHGAKLPCREILMAAVRHIRRDDKAHCIYLRQ